MTKLYILNDRLYICSEDEMSQKIQQKCDVNDAGPQTTFQQKCDVNDAGPQMTFQQKRDVTDAGHE